MRVGLVGSPMDALVTVCSMIAVVYVKQRGIYTECWLDRVIYLVPPYAQVTSCLLRTRMKHPFVTVVIPAFNAERFLERVS